VVRILLVFAAIRAVSLSKKAPDGGFLPRGVGRPWRRLLVRGRFAGHGLFTYRFFPGCARGSGVPQTTNRLLGTFSREGRLDFFRNVSAG